MTPGRGTRPQVRQDRPNGFHLGPDVGKDRDVGRDQRLGAGLLHDAGDLRGFEEVVHGVGDSGDLRAPQREEGLRYARHQQRHGVVGADAVCMQQVRGLDRVAQQLLEADIAHRIGDPGPAEIPDGDPAGVLRRGRAQQVEDIAVADALGHRHLLEVGDVCLRADLHWRFFPGLVAMFGAI